MISQIRIKNRSRLLFATLALVITLLISGAAVTYFQGWFAPYNDLLAGIATKPEDAVRDMLQVQANGLQDFRVIVDEPWGVKRLVIFAYTIQPPNAPPHAEFGHALVEMRVGWSATPGMLAADAAPPALITYLTTQIDGAAVVYGKVLDPRVHTVEVTFDSGQSLRTTPTTEGFVLSTSKANNVVSVRMLDAQGLVLQQYTSPNLHRPANCS